MIGERVEVRGRIQTRKRQNSRLFTPDRPRGRKLHTAGGRQGLTQVGREFLLYLDLKINTEQIKGSDVTSLEVKKGLINCMIDQMCLEGGASTW